MVWVNWGWSWSSGVIRSLNIENDFLDERSFATNNDFAAADIKAGCAMCMKTGKAIECRLKSGRYAHFQALLVLYLCHEEFWVGHRVPKYFNNLHREKLFSPDTHWQTPLDGLSVRKVSGMQGQESLQLCVCILRVLRHVALIFVNFATWAYLWKYSHGAKLTQHQSLRFTLHQVCISSQISWIWRRCDKRWYYC